MALLAAASDTVMIGVGTFAWWGAYLSNARRKLVFTLGDTPVKTGPFILPDEMVL